SSQCRMCGKGREIPAFRLLGVNSMNKVLFLLLLPCVFSNEALAESQFGSLKLTGLISVGETKRAIFFNTANPDAAWTHVILAEGQRDGAIEVTSIAPEARSVEVRLNVTNSQVLRLTNSTVVPGVCFEQVSLHQLIRIYSDLVNRTVLRFPTLPEHRFKLDA